MKKFILIIISLLLTSCAKTGTKTADSMTIKTTKSDNPVISLKTDRSYKKIQLTVSAYQNKKWQDVQYRFPVKNKACRLTLKLNSGVIVYQSDVLYRSRKFKKANYRQWAFIKDGRYQASKSHHVAGLLNDDQADISLAKGKNWHPGKASDIYVLLTVRFVSN